MVNPTLLLIFVIAATAGLIWTASIWSASGFLDKLIKTFYSAFSMLGIIIALKLLGVL